MEFLSLLAGIIVILCSIPENTAVPTETPLLNCFYCTSDFKDPFCGEHKIYPCPGLIPGSSGFCYRIMLKSTGVAYGCTQKEDYCEHYDDHIGPMIYSCHTCDTDNCNYANETKLFYSLIFSCVLISLLLP